MATYAEATQLAVDYTGPGTTTLIAGVAGSRIAIVKLCLTTTIAANISFQSSGGTTHYGPQAWAIEGGILLPVDNLPWIVCDSGEGLQMVVDIAAQIGGNLWYVTL